MPACIQEPLVTNSQQVTGHEFCMVWAHKCLVRCGVYSPPPPRGGGGGRHLASDNTTPPPRMGGNRHPSGRGNSKGGGGYEHSPMCVTLIVCLLHVWRAAERVAAWRLWLLACPDLAL